MYLQKTAKMWLFAVTDITAYSYEVTLWSHFVTFIAGDWAALQPWLVTGELWQVTGELWQVMGDGLSNGWNRRGEGAKVRKLEGLKVSKTEMGRGEEETKRLSDLAT